MRRLFIGLFIGLLLTSCKTQYIEVEKPVVVHDSIRVSSIEHRTDTLWQNTEVRITDTLWLDTSTVATLGMPVLHHERATEKTTDKGQSSTSSKADTVYVYVEKPVPVTKTVEVEKQLTKWQKTKMDMGGMAIGAVLLVVIVAIVYAVIRIRRMAKPLP